MNAKTRLAIAALAALSAVSASATLAVETKASGSGDNVLSWPSDGTGADPWSGNLTGRINNYPDIFANFSSSSTPLVYSSGAGQSTIVASPVTDPLTPFGNFSLTLNPISAPATNVSFMTLTFGINATAAGFGLFTGGGDTEIASFSKSGGVQWFTVTSTTPIETFTFQTFSGAGCTAASLAGPDCTATSLIAELRQVRVGDIATPVPEPSAALLALAGLGVLGLMRRRRKVD